MHDETKTLIRNTIISGLEETIKDYLSSDVAKEADDYDLGVTLAAKFYDSEESEELLLDCLDAAANSLKMDKDLIIKILGKVEKRVFGGYPGLKTTTKHRSI